MRSHALAAAAAVLLLSLSPSHAVTWTNANKWLVVPNARFNCVTVLPIRAGYAFIGSYCAGARTWTCVYGYNGSWVYISARQMVVHSDTVIFNALPGTTTVMACAWGFGGTSQFDLYYAVGN